MKHPFFAFKALVESFKIVPGNAPETPGCYLLVKKGNEMVKDGAPYFPPGIQLIYDPTTGPTLNSLIKKVSVWLNEKKHPVFPNFAEVIIGVIAWKVENGCSMEEAFEQIEETTGTADVTFFLFLPSPVPSTWATCLEWEGYQLGQPDLARMERCIRNVGGAWVDVAMQQKIIPAASSSLRGMPGIASPVFHKKVIIDFVGYDGDPSSAQIDMLNELNGHYWNFMSLYHLYEMWEDFERKRQIPAALGYRFMQVDTFRSTHGHIQVGTYSNFSTGRRNGRLYLGYHREQIELLDLLATKDALAEMEKRYNLSSIDKSSLAPLLRAVCRTVNRGMDRLGKYRLSDAYLQFIIALEQVFSEKENTTRMVSGRSAALLHRQLSLSFEDCRGMIVELYNARSRYVHNGIDIHPEHLSKAVSIPEPLVRSLIYLCNLPDSSDDGFYKKWLDKLDWIVAGFDAGITPHNRIFEELGVIGPEPPLPGSGEPNIPIGPS